MRLGFPTGSLAEEMRIMQDDQAQLDLLDRILGRNLAWITAADAKVTPLLAINTTMLGVLATLAPQANSWTIYSSIATFLAVLALFGSIISLILATFPRLNGPKSSILFFGGISSYEEDHYLEKVLQGINPEIHKDFARQCYRNAEIAKEKYRFIKYAMIFSFTSVPAWVVAIALLYQIKGLVV